MNGLQANYRRRGVTLIEMFCAMTLLVVFAVVATHLFGSVIGVYQTTERTHTRVSRYESAIQRMRKDVWSAHKIVLLDPRNMELTGSDGKIRWGIDTTGTLARTVEDGSTNWEGAGKNLSFARDSQGVLVKEKGEDPALATRLFNQAEQSAGWER